MPTIHTPQQARELLDDTFYEMALKRAHWRKAAVPIPGIDSPKEVELKLGLLLHEVLPKWAEDPLMFLEQCAWAPDPLEKYADHTRLQGLAPKQAVPLFLFDRQKDFVKLWWEAISSREEYDIFGEKSRQQAVTTMAVWLSVHTWLFKSATTGVLSTYKDDYLDGGGKGSRDATSLFGRFRMFLDYFMWSFGPCFDSGVPSLLKFNQHEAPSKPTNKKAYQAINKWKAWMKNYTGMNESQDVTNKIVRPRWRVNQVDLFPGAEGNWVIGALPGESVARSLTPTYILFDELAHYNTEIAAGADKKSYGATAPNSRVRVGWGTPPEGGDANSLLYERIHLRPRKSDRVWRMHWIHNPVWMAGAAWICKECGHNNPLPMHPPPKFPVDEIQCQGCQTLMRVETRGTEAPSGGDITSPRYRTACDRMTSKRQVAAELEIDWGGAQGDALFSTWDGTISRKRFEPQQCMVLDGLDPGNSLKNTGAWFASIIDPMTQRIQLVAYWMSTEPLAEFWIPFLKRWDHKRLERARFTYGKHAGKRFVDVFDYPREAYRVLEILQEYRLPVGEVEGDKYGSHNNMSYSAYDVLRDYGVDVSWSYTQDREALVRAGIEWAARMEIHDQIADLQPVDKSGILFPSPKQVFLTARPRDQAGQSAYKLDVDKKEPEHVHNAVDGYLYIVKRLMGTEIHANVSGDGDWGVDPFDSGEVTYYGGDRSLG